MYLRNKHFKNKFLASITKKSTAILVMLFLFASFMSVPLASAIPGPSVQWGQVIGGLFGPVASYVAGDGPVGGPRNVIKITDLSAAGAGSIKVHVTSNRSPSGTFITLDETPPGSGTFENTRIIFTNGTGEIQLGNLGYTKVTFSFLDTDGNCHPATIDTIPDTTGDCTFTSNPVQITSTSDPVGITPTFTETGPNTGIFSAVITLTTAHSGGNSLHVSNGDELTVFDQNSGLTTNYLVTPNTDATVGDISVFTGGSGGTSDVVTATYKGVSVSANILDDTAPTGSGGGGGGIIANAGLVVDFIGVSLAGVFENVFHPPSLGNDYRYPYGGGITINGKPFDIENYATIIPAQVLQVGKPATFDFKIYDERGAYAVSHAGMYFHFKGDPSVLNADTWVSWDRYQGFETHDPNKIFSKTSVDVKTDGNFFHVTFNMTPQKPMPDSSLIMRMWDDKREVGDVPIWGAIVIVDPNAPVPVKKIPTNQYDDHVILEKILDKDGYYIPTLLNKLHGMHDIYSSLDINWVYDKGVDKLTLVESDKSGNLVGSLVCDLYKKTIPPTVTDHDFFNFTSQQLNRQNLDQEEAAKHAEAQKAEKLLESLDIIRQNNFESSK